MDFLTAMSVSVPNGARFFLKVLNAASHGASAVIIYNDPEQYAPEGTNNTFPNSWWLPDSGTQRGSARKATGPGDPLTPGFPSVDGIYREALNGSDSLPIPAMVLSYGDAQEILRRMKGQYPFSVGRGVLLRAGSPN